MSGDLGRVLDTAIARALETESGSALRPADAFAGQAELDRPDEPAPGSLAERFARAVQRGFDSGNEAAAGGARTTDYSVWLGDVCPFCRHTFRAGDRVRADRSGTVHDEPFLPCHEHAEGSASAWPRPSALAERLNAAAEREDPGPFPSLRLHRLVPGHPLLRCYPRAGRQTCLGCAHTFRPFELVAQCPCSPFERRCRLAAHRDAAAGLLCYDPVAANPDMKHCPMSFNKLRDDRSLPR